MKHIHFSVLLLSAGITVMGCRQPKPAEKVDSSIPVKVISATSLQEKEPLETSGLLSSDQQSNLSFKSGGIIHSILVKEGDRVRKGQVLARLNLTEINAQLSQARENFNKALRDAQRISNLYKDSVSTKEQYEHMQTALTIAKKQLEIAQFNAGQSTIIASTTGVVLKKYVNEGEQVAGGSPVVLIGGTAEKDWIIKCGITDKDRARMTGNERAEISFDAYPQTFSGTLKSLAQGSDNSSGLYQVEVRLDPGKVTLVAGLFANVKIYPQGKADLLSVPMDALVEGKNDSAYVFITSGNKALKKPVKVAYLKGDKVFLSSGLAAEDRVIREGSAYLTDGSLVKIIK